jgi:GNAT superfamily N-acetyltransferase
MNIHMRNYTGEKGCSNEDFYRILDFLHSNGAVGLNENWHWARWEWLMGHPNLKKEMVPIIGIWECDNKVIGIATHDMRLGQAYFICNIHFDFIKKEMLLYAEKSLAANGKLQIAVNDIDNDFSSYLSTMDYHASESKETVLSIECKHYSYSLPQGFSISSYRDNKDPDKYNTVIWKGFNHEGLPPRSARTDEETRPHFNPSHAVFVIAPDGEYAAHCGAWYEEGEKTAYIEPVCTVPEYRKRGLAKVAVYEAMKRCSRLGAERAIVVSNQDFYYKIGFETSSIYSFWRKNISILFN